MHKDLKYWLSFSRVPQIGSSRLLRLLKYFPDLKTAWEATQSDYLAAGLDQRTVNYLHLSKKSIIPDSLVAELEKYQIKICLFIDADYPPLLKQIYDPPALLYYRGQLINNQPLLAIVGTRKISAYGIQVIKDLIPPLCQYQLVTVSGLALGVDALVHQKTIQANGQTMAVLGSGLDDENLYPSSNRFLAKQIITNGGAIISEYPPGTLPLKQHFPRRNRIISGLTSGVLVIEGDIESGSLITAASALEQNREVMAVPGSIYSANSTGPNQLIKQGAHMITHYRDILEILDLQEISATSQPAAPTDPQQKIIWDILSSEPITVDELIRQTGLNAAIINMHLSLLELNNLVHKMADGKIIKKGN